MENDSTSLICTLCNNQIFARRSHYFAHLKTKKHIYKQLEVRGLVRENDDILGLHEKMDKIIQEFEIKDTIHKEILRKYNDCLESYKFIKSENKELKEELGKLRSDITNLKKKSGGNTTNIRNMTNTMNTINNNSVNIHLGVCPFGRENWDYLSTDVVLPIMKRVNECVPEMIKRLHFDEGHPENHNMFIPNKRINQIKVFDGTQWETKEKNVTLEELKNKIIHKLETEYEAYFIRETSQFLRNLWEKLKDGENTKYDQKQLKNSIEYAILDNHKIVKKTVSKIS